MTLRITKLYSCIAGAIWQGKERGMCVAPAGSLSNIAHKKQVMVVMVILLLIVSLGSCIIDDVTIYKVVVTGVSKGPNAHYCTYYVDRISEPKYYQDYFLAECNLYVPGDTVIIKR